MTKLLAFLMLASLGTTASAAVTNKVLQCGYVESMPLGISYAVQIKESFNTHARNPDGTFGVLERGVYLLKSPIAPNPTVRADLMKQMNVNADGSLVFFSSESNAEVTLKPDMSQAQLVMQFGKVVAISICNELP